MHKEILSSKQIELLPLIKEFSKRFTLVGGTAIGLQIGHRRSIDFDLFSAKLNKLQLICLAEPSVQNCLDSNYHILKI